MYGAGVDAQSVQGLFLFDMFTEKDLETIIYNNLDECHKRGLDFYWGEPLYFRRQVKIGNYGVADLIHAIKDCNEFGQPIVRITVIEIKKDIVKEDGFWQLVRYMRGVERYLEERDVSFKFQIDGILLGKGFESKPGLCFANSVCENIDYYTYIYDADGIRFEYRFPYYLDEEGFNLKGKEFKNG